MVDPGDRPGQDWFSEHEIGGFRLSVVRPRPRPTLPPVEGFHDGLCDRGGEAASASLRPCPPYHRTYDDPPQSDPPNGEDRGKISIDNKTAGVHRGEGSTSRGATPQRVRRSTNPQPRLLSGPVELVVGEAGDGFGTGPGANPESAQIPVAALGLQHHSRRATLSQMRKRRVTHLVQSPPTGVTSERLQPRCGRRAGLGRSGRRRHGGRWDCGSGRW